MAVVIEPAAGPLASPFKNREAREAERSVKREAVLVAAVRMFNERGFHATSLDDVAASLGVSKPTIYHYLGTKDQVLLECVTRGLSQLREAADTARAQDGSGLDRLRAFLCRYAEINMADFGKCVIRTGDEMLSEASAGQFRALKRQIDEAMRALIHEAVAEGSVVAEDVRLTAFTLAGALNWPARWYRESGTFDAAQTAGQMVAILLNGLLPR